MTKPRFVPNIPTLSLLVRPTQEDMPPSGNKDAALKKAIAQVLVNCGLEDPAIDREVQINYSGETDKHGNLLSDKEIDVVARFRYGGLSILFLFECENSSSASGKRKEYKDYDSSLKDIAKHSQQLRILNSLESKIRAWHFQNADEIRVCFVYGNNFSETGIQIVDREARKYDFIVWSYFALQYYLKISAILGSWTRYELFKDFGLKLEGKSTVTIPAIEIKQNDSGCISVVFIRVFCLRLPMWFEGPQKEHMLIKGC